MSFITSNFRVQYQWDDTSGPGLTWTTITDSLLGIKIHRNHKSASTLTVSLVNNLLDPSLHPGNDEHITKGQKCRAQVLVGGNWKSVFTGTISRPDVTFVSIGDKAISQRVITFTAHDSAHKRHQKMHSHGVGASDDLRAFVDPPFNINGLSTTKSSTGVNTFEHDNTSEWDQILMTRDSEQGFAWIDKEDILNVTTRGSKSASTTATILPSDYSKVDLNYTLENVINVVVVKEIQKRKNGKTHVVHKGVWERSGSIDKYGRFKAVYTVQDHTHTFADDAAFANNILDKNAQPAVVPTGCTIPIVTTGDVSAFLDAIEILDKVTINVDGTIYSVRVDDITIDSDGTLLTMSMKFSHQDIVYKPHKTPNKNTGNANLASKDVETDLLDDDAVTPTKTSYPVISNIGATSPPTPKDGTLWIDTSSGNMLKQYDAGTASWTSVQDTAIATAQATANGKNRVVYSTSDPGSTPNTAGDLWFTFSGTLISKQWKGNGGTSWTQVTITNSVISNLDAGKITTGFLNAARIQVGSLTTDKLVVGSGTNWIPNPGFEAGTIAPHVGIGASVLTASSAQPVHSGTWTGITTLGSTRAAGSFAYDYTFAGPALDASGLHLPVKAGDVIYGELWIRSGAGAPDARIYIDAISSTGTRLSNTPDAGTQVQVTVTPTYQKMSVQMTMPSGAAYASLNLAFANCTAGNSCIIDDALLTKQIEGVLLVNGAIDGKTITGSTIQTASSGNRLVMRDDGSAGRIDFYSGISGESPGYFNPDIYLSSIPRIIIASGTTPTNAFAGKVSIYSGTTTDAATVGITGALVVPGTAEVGSLIVDSGANISGVLLGNSTWTNTGDTHARKLFADNHDSDTGSANVRFNNNQQLVNATSLSKYKLKQVPLSLDEALGVLELTPITWFDKSEYEANKKRYKGLRRIPGVVAEDVETHTPTLATYDRNGDLEAVAYDRGWVYLIPLVRDQQKRIEKLESLVLTQ